VLQRVRPGIFGDQLRFGYFPKFLCGDTGCRHEKRENGAPFAEKRIPAFPFVVFLTRVIGLRRQSVCVGLKQANAAPA